MSSVTTGLTAVEALRADYLKAANDACTSGKERSYPTLAEIERWKEMKRKLDAREHHLTADTL